MTNGTPALTLRVVRVEELTAAERKTIIDLCSAAYAERFDHLFETLPNSIHVLAYLDDVIVSHAEWVMRWLQPEGRTPLRTAYVEAVATAPAHQRHGFATSVMRELKEHIDDFDLAALSPSDHHFYERLGWELWRGPLAIRTERGVLSTPDEEVMILRLPRTPRLDVNSQLTAEWRVGELW